MTPARWYIVVGALAAVVVAILVVASLPLPDWFQPVWTYILEVGLPATLRVSAIAVVGSALIGVVLGTLLTIDFVPLKALIRGYIEVFRGLPILVTVFMVYFGLPEISTALKFDAPCSPPRSRSSSGAVPRSPRPTRGAVQSIPREQHEAAAALGFGWSGRHAFVILPQALRRLLPPFVSLLVNIIQNSTLAQVIGGVEILQAAKSQNERLSFPEPIGIGEIHAFEIFTGVMILFFLISFPLTRLAAVLEKRLARAGYG